MERPNTVSGLLAKRDELLKLRKELEAQARKVTCDIDHLDACIHLFDPESTPAAVRLYTTRHRAQKGHLKRFLLAYLRDATAPVTSKDVTNAWIQDRGLRADDATYVILRKRIGACLTGLKADGLARAVALEGDYKGWELIRT